MNIFENLWNLEVPAGETYSEIVRMTATALEIRKKQSMCTNIHTEYFTGEAGGKERAERSEISGTTSSTTAVLAYCPRERLADSSISELDGQQLKHAENFNSKNS